MMTIQIKLADYLYDQQRRAAVWLEPKAYTAIYPPTRRMRQILIASSLLRYET